MSFVIGSCDCFGLVLQHLNENRPVGKLRVNSSLSKHSLLTMTNVTKSEKFQNIVITLISRIAHSRSQAISCAEQSNDSETAS